MLPPFSGEDDADFQETLKLVKAVGYAQAYSFKDSPRPGTPAAKAPDQVPEDVKKERLAELQALLNAQQTVFNKASKGRILEVLFERQGKFENQIVGRSPYMQAVHVALDEPGDTKEKYFGHILPVEILAVGPNSLKGKLLTGQLNQSAA